MSQAANERIRRQFKPREIRALFVGESPPSGGTFFYRANSKLYFATREAFEAAIPALRKEVDFLDAFKRLGYEVSRATASNPEAADGGTRSRSTRP